MGTYTSVNLLSHVLRLPLPLVQPNFFHLSTGQAADYDSTDDDYEKREERGNGIACQVPTAKSPGLARPNNGVKRGSQGWQEWHHANGKMWGFIN